MEHLTAVVIGDIALVLVLSTLFGAAARRVGQPAVVGQILAGICLGPSVLGRLPGHLTSRFLPHEALPFLSVISQVAVALFMFGIGYELSRHSFRDGYRVALLIALTALLVPMGLGAGSVLVFRSSFEAVNQADISHSFVLYMGVATSV